MYSTMPWIDREVWFMDWPYDNNPLAGFKKEADDVRILPSPQNILRLAGKVKKKYNASGFAVEVWEPLFLEDGSLTRVMITKVDVR